MMNLSERELGLAAKSLRILAQRIFQEMHEIRQGNPSEGDLAICDILIEQANEQMKLADKIDEGMWE